MVKTATILFALVILAPGCVSENEADGADTQDESYPQSYTVSRGQPVPPFKIELADKPGFVSDETLRGQFYLIDFWAVWCKPCVMEMPILHQVYEKFKDDNFTILSLSLDMSWQHVEQFREDWEMPWMHGFLEGGFGNPLARRFGVYGIPRPILVGPDGNVLAMEIELRGEMLERTLSRYIGGRP